MKVIENEVVIAFDIDNTLVHKVGVNQGDLKIQEPYQDTPNYYDYRINFEHVNLMRTMKGRGRFIIAWSAGGYKWAEAVCKALNIDDLVDLYMTKPTSYVDDLPFETFCPRIYLGDK